MVRNNRRSRKQRGGGDSYGMYGYTGPAGVSAGGVPFESRAADNSHCGWNYRAAPQLGGRRSRKQRGGSCSCNSRMQLGGGSGNGGYGVELSNQLGKVYDHLQVGPCASQRGGASPLDLVSYPAGYEFGPKGVVSTDSAHYLDPIGYDRSCRGGYRKSHRKSKGRKSHRKSKGRKSHRKAHRKSQ